MLKYVEINGDLIKMAQEGMFDVVAHGCNCYCTMKKGLAPKMAYAFNCDKFPLEVMSYKGDINKLGQIDYGFALEPNVVFPVTNFRVCNYKLLVVNCYIQFHWEGEQPLVYDALALCLRKMNYVFKGKRIGLPKIGCGLAGGNWDVVKEMIHLYMPDCEVTIAIKDEQPEAGNTESNSEASKQVQVRLLPDQG